MTDDGPILEPIGRRGPPLAWVGGLVAVLGVVVATAVGGRLEPAPSSAATDRGEAVVEGSVVSADPVRTSAPVTSPRRSPAPIWYRPSPWPMGEDGLAGGTAYSSPRPSADPGDFDPLR